MDYRSGPVQEFYSPGSPEDPAEEERPPAYPPRPQQHQPEPLMEEHNDEKPPLQPPRPSQQIHNQSMDGHDEEHPPPYPPRPEQYHPPPPPRRIGQTFDDDDPSSPLHYARDPHKLIAYLIPFPKPSSKNAPPEKIPDRFLIYTPPPPPLSKPAEGEGEGKQKEEKLHKVQRKWQEEVRDAKTNTAPATSWKGIRSRATRGIDWAVGQTTSSSLDFINRLGGDSSANSNQNPSVAAPHTRRSDEHATPANLPDRSRSSQLTDLLILYPPSLRPPGADPSSADAALRAEFIASMLRTKTKAQRDAVLATGLLPVSFAVDVLVTVVWPFGGLVEMDAVWLYASARGARVARATARRLGNTAGPRSSSAGSAPPSGAQMEDERATGEEPVAGTESVSGNDDEGRTEYVERTDGQDRRNHEQQSDTVGKSKEDEEDKLKLTFTPSTRLDVLRRYLAARCHERDPALFASAGGPSPTETEVLQAIGWAPSRQLGRSSREDEQWEMAEAKDDFRQVLTKAAREWDSWCKAFAKNPEKALKK